MKIRVDRVLTLFCVYYLAPCASPPPSWKFGNPGILESANPENWDPNNPKHDNYQNHNPLCPKCRQGLHQQEQKHPDHFWDHSSIFVHGPKNATHDGAYQFFLVVQHSNRFLFTLLAFKGPRGSRTAILPWVNAGLDQCQESSKINL